MPGFMAVLVAILAFAQPARALEWSLEASELSAAGVAVRHLEIESGAARVARIGIDGVTMPMAGAVGDLVIRCASPGRLAACTGGELAWLPDAESRHAATFARGAGSIELRWGEPGDSIEDRPAISVRYGADGPAIEASGLDLSLVPVTLLDSAGLAALDGVLGISASARGSAVELRVRGTGLEFDTPDGSMAGAGVAIEISTDAERSETETDEREAWSFDSAMQWRAGELLLGPAYLPAPASPVELAARGRWTGAESGSGFGWVELDAVRLNQAEVVDLIGQASVDLAEMPPKIVSGKVRVEQLSLGPAWAAGLSSLASSSGLSALTPSGQLGGSARFEDGALDRLELELAGVSVDDPQGRLGVSRLDGALAWHKEAVSLEIDFDSAALYRIPLGATRLHVRTVDGNLELADPLEIPVLDGALVFDRFVVRDWRRPDREFEIDARLRPLDLAALTEALGWQRLGGSLSGRFPGVRFADGVLDFDGSIDVELFSGSAIIRGLSIERPLGTLPALAADIEFELLDLEQVTGAFEFGAMSGRLSGYMRGLRLLDWQPVAFDAWLHTPLGVDGKRRISQKAVDSISSLGGGGAAMLSAPLLSLFDDFGYRQVGLGCRLAANVCQMRGVEDVDGGGYRIVEGRGIPRLDVVGYKRRVDWPQLLAQLQAAAGGAPPRTGQAPD